MCGSSRDVVIVFYHIPTVSSRIDILLPNLSVFVSDKSREREGANERERKREREREREDERDREREREREKKRESERVKTEYSKC
jgi:hypothetical protein